MNTRYVPMVRLRNSSLSKKHKVIIAVQARSTSSRLPGKSLELIETQTMTDHVLDSCWSASQYINRNRATHGINSQVVLLVPHDDKLVKSYEGRLEIVQGSETDVLSRYIQACNRYHPTHIVRITGDCPLMSSALITKHIMCAVKDGLDYCSNVTDGCRTFIDGWDVEVMSIDLMHWLDQNAVKEYDREHVTTLCREKPPHWAHFGTVIGRIDFSDIKLSVDTRDELEAVRRNQLQVKEKTSKAKELGHAVYQF